MNNEQQTTKLYYSIGEVAEMFSLSLPTLRYWEKVFPSLHPNKNRRGVRLYKKGDIELIKQIVYLTRDKRLTLEGAKKALSEQRIQGSKQEILDTLIETRDFLKTLKGKIDIKDNIE